MTGRLIYFIIISIFIFAVNASDFDNLNKGVTDYIQVRSGLLNTIVALMTVPMLVFDMEFGAVGICFLIIIEAIYISIYTFFYFKIRKKQEEERKMIYEKIRTTPQFHIVIKDGDEMIKMGSLDKDIENNLKLMMSMLGNLPKEFIDWEEINSFIVHDMSFDSASLQWNILEDTLRTDKISDTSLTVLKTLKYDLYEFFYFHKVAEEREEHLRRMEICIRRKYKGLPDSTLQILMTDYAKFSGEMIKC